MNRTISPPRPAANPHAAIAPGPGVAPGGHFPRMIMPSTSSFVIAVTGPAPTTWPFFITVTRSARSNTSWMS